MRPAHSIRVRVSRIWWDNVLSSTEPVGLCYPSILGFIRLGTNRRLFEKPLTVELAIGHVERWFGQPNTIVVVPTMRHWALLAKLLSSVGVGANLTTDAHIAGKPSRCESTCLRSACIPIKNGALRNVNNTWLAWSNALRSWVSTPNVAKPVMKSALVTGNIPNANTLSSTEFVMMASSKSSE